MNNYTDFLAKKTKSNLIAGFDYDATIYNLFDFQSAIVSWACKRGRAGIFADTGLGKTAMQVAWADQVVKHTQGRRFVGAELKRSYWDLACRNLATAKSSQGTLLDLAV